MECVICLNVVCLLLVVWLVGGKVVCLIGCSLFWVEMWIKCWHRLYTCERVLVNSLKIGQFLITGLSSSMLMGDRGKSGIITKDRDLRSSSFHVPKMFYMFSYSKWHGYHYSLSRRINFLFS